MHRDRLANVITVGLVAHLVLDLGWARHVLDGRSELAFRVLLIPLIVGLVLTMEPRGERSWLRIGAVTVGIVTLGLGAVLLLFGP